MLKKREGERERERVKLSTYLRPSYLTVDRSEKILPITLGKDNFWRISSFFQGPLPCPTNSRAPRICLVFLGQMMPLGKPYRRESHRDGKSTQTGNPHRRENYAEGITVQMGKSGRKENHAE